VLKKQPFETVVADHGPTVLRVCLAVLGPSEADDARSETFLSAMKAYPELPADANIEAWLRRTYPRLTDMRHQPTPGCRSLPPRRASRRLHGRLRRRARRQARPAHPGDRSMTTTRTPTTVGTSASTTADPTGHWAKRVDRADWATITSELDAYGCALTGPLLTPDEAAEIAARYTDDSRFRSTINMGRHRFGEGEYRYFARTLPRRRRRAEAGAVPAAAVDRARLVDQARSRDAVARQPRRVAGHVPPGDWNALHRDLYGELVFPLQVVINLNAPGVDHTGGEFLFYEQRPRGCGWRRSSGPCWRTDHEAPLAVFITRRCLVQAGHRAGRRSRRGHRGRRRW
jgi:uncharacterized protein